MIMSGLYISCYILSSSKATSCPFDIRIRMSNTMLYAACTPYSLSYCLFIYHNCNPISSCEYAHELFLVSCKVNRFFYPIHANSLQQTIDIPLHLVWNAHQLLLQIMQCLHSSSSFDQIRQTIHYVSTTMGQSGCAIDLLKELAQPRINVYIMCLSHFERALQQGTLNLSND
eukprot:781034_1